MGMFSATFGVRGGTSVAPLSPQTPRFPVPLSWIVVHRGESAQRIMGK